MNMAIMWNHKAETLESKAATNRAMFKAEYRLLGHIDVAEVEALVFDLERKAFLCRCAALSIVETAR